MKTTTPSAEITKTYRRTIPNTWWLKRASYFWFMLRELSSVFVALYVIFLLFQIKAIAGGADSYASWLDLSQSGGMVLLHLVILLFVLYHTVTWFRISGRIFGFGGLTPAAVVAANYIVWIVVSIGVILLLMKG